VSDPKCEVCGKPVYRDEEYRANTEGVNCGAYVRFFYGGEWIYKHLFCYIRTKEQESPQEGSNGDFLDAEGKIVRDTELSSKIDAILDELRQIREKTGCAFEKVALDIETGKRLEALEKTVRYIVDVFAGLVDEAVAQKLRSWMGMG
jgi:hypothetical protein